MSNQGCRMGFQSGAASFDTICKGSLDVAFSVSTAQTNVKNEGSERRGTQRHALGDPGAASSTALIDLCQCMHCVVEPAEGYTVLECEGNVARYDCIACKAFKGVGICSHVLAVNHVLTKFNVRYELKAVETGASKKAAVKAGKRPAKPLPALKPGEQSILMKEALVTYFLKRDIIQ